MQLLFIVLQDGKVLYHCHSILELFRLREVFKPNESAELYRYVDTQRYTDKYFQWNKNLLVWEISEVGIGFGRASFAQLEVSYNMLKKMRRLT